MPDHVLHDDPFYRLTAHGPVRHPTSIIAFDIRSVRRHQINPGAFAEPFLPLAMRQAEGPANFLSLQTSRNCWYLDPALDAVLDKARAFCAGTRIVTYGSSMGAYASINLAGALGADFALALSPLSTMFDPYMSSIGDKRYPSDRKVLSPERDRIGRGDMANLRGLICFDSTHAADAAHTARIASLTRCDLLDVKHGGHPCGVMLNRIYPLRRLLSDVAKGEPDLAELRTILLREGPKSQEALAADPARVGEFYALCDSDLAQIRPTSMANAAALAQNMPEALGDDPATRAARLWKLAGWLGDPAMNWAADPAKRYLAVCAVFDAARAQGLKGLAKRISGTYLKGRTPAGSGE